MITIYKNRTTKQAAMQIVQVLKRVDKSNLSVMHTVIVPDRASLEMERLILAEIGGSFNVQVLTFRRLASRILPKYEYLSKQAGIMALAGIIQDSKPLACYTKGVDSPGFVADMYDTISMMKYCKISPESLESAKLPKSVSGKAKDIAKLYRGYLDYTKGRFIDSADKLDLLCDALPTVESVKNGHFYLCDFDNLSAQELALVEQLMLTSRGVAISCCVGNQHKDSSLYLNDIYTGVLKVCERNQIVANVVDNYQVDANKHTGQIGEHLYRYTTPAPIDNDGFVEIFQAENRYKEVYNLACLVQKYVRSGGRFKDVYVVTSDVEKYTNSITNVFAQLQIPYFCDRQFALADQPYAQFVLDYLHLCRNNGRLQNVLSFVKNYLFYGDFDGQTDESAVYKFENFCLKYNVSFRYDNFFLGAKDYYYASANAFRDKFNALYQKITFPQSAKAVVYVKTIRQLLAEWDVDNKNAIFASRQLERGYSAEANVTKQSVEKLEQVLTQAETILGERYLTLEEFTKVLTATVASVKISVIPQHNDCVVFANMAKARKHDIKFLALLGANYGVMPIVKKDCKLLTDANIQALEDANLHVEPQIATENKRERFSLFQLLLEPTDKLYVSYPVTDGTDSLTPSPFVEQLCNLFCDGVDKNGQPIVVTPTEEEIEEVFTEKQAIAKVVLNKRKQTDKQMVKMPSFNVLSNVYADQAQRYQFAKNGQNLTIEQGDKLFFKSSRTSVSQLTQFFECPYNFFLCYGLNAKPRDLAQLKSSDSGTILHDVLEHYVKQIDVDETDEVTKQKANVHFDNALSNDVYRALKNDPRMRGRLDQLRDEAVTMCNVIKKQFAKSKFRNIQTELSFDGKNAPMVQVDYGQGVFNLNGKIDRIDAFGEHMIIIDYKSGETAADYNEKGLYHGAKLQLLVYLRAAQDSYNYRPAGFYYFVMHNDFADVGADKVYGYKGRTLSDVTIASAIDTDLQTTGSSEMLNLKLTKKGELDKKTTSHITAEQMDHQVAYAMELIKRAGNLMHKGYVAVSPFGKHPCSYCDYKSICDFGDVFAYGEREVQGRVTAKAISNIVTSKGVTPTDTKTTTKGEGNE